MSRLVYDHADIMAELASLRLLVQHGQAAMTQALQTIARQETDMAKKLPEYIADLQTRLDALTVDVAEGKTVGESAITLINGLTAQNAAFKAQIQELIDAGGTPENIAKLQAIVDAMDAADAAFDTQKAALAAAVAANTPAEPTA